MKKLLIYLTVILVLFSGCSNNSKESESSGEEEIMPIRYSEPIYIMTEKNSDINAIEDLKDHVLAVQIFYDHESSDYVLEQLTDLELTEENIYESEFYSEIIDLLHDELIDAWVISKGEHEMLSDYRIDYIQDNYKIVAEYQIPYYEEEKVDQAILNNPLYKEPFAVMLTGIDERVDPDNYKAARNDVNILLLVDPQNRHITTISFPRDSYIVNACTGYKDKLTHFGMNGTECIKDSIADLLDIDVDYFVQVSFSTFLEVIDSLGGVYVDVPLDMRMDQDSYRNVAQPYSLKKGYTKLLGEWALALARNRKYSNLYNGDYGRIRNQALIFNGIVEKIAEHSFLLNWAGWSWKQEYLAYHNFTDEDLKALFALSNTFSQGYTIDNYFMENDGATTESGMSIGIIPDYSLQIAKLKARYTLNLDMDEKSPYYEAAMTGYVTGGAGTYNDGYIGEEYQLELREQPTEDSNDQINESEAEE